jgi:glycerol-3-phosphate O-acyltransferase 3/4
MTSLIPLLPWSNARRWCYDWAARTCFRILSRSISAVITFHNRELRPKSDGICVANHTTPIDVFILSCDKTYAMVTSWSICADFFPPRGSERPLPVYFSYV